MCRTLIEIGEFDERSRGIHRHSEVSITAHSAGENVVVHGQTVAKTVRKKQDTR